MHVSVSCKPNLGVLNAASTDAMHDPPDCHILSVPCILLLYWCFAVVARVLLLDLLGHFTMLVRLCEACCTTLSTSRRPTDKHSRQPGYYESS